jgi:hypothetical protein
MSGTRTKAEHDGTKTMFDTIAEVDLSRRPFRVVIRRHRRTMEAVDPD